jgi:N-acetylneuraminate synthase
MVDMNKTYIIAEAGVNHNASEDLALEMITRAKEIGADAIKFQLFQAESLVTEDAEQAQYQKKAYTQAKTQFQMLKELELPHRAFERLKNHAKKEQIDFIITPFDLASLDFITQKLNLDVIKIGSGDVTNGPLLLATARSKKKIILSTGMSTLSDIEMALKVIAFGLLTNDETPSLKAFDEAYSHVNVQSILKAHVSLLHCTSEYPAPVEESNLKAMDTLRAAFGLRVGFSDHTPGIEISLAAVARDAAIIEKHFTLDKNLPGPDHLASLDYLEFKTMIDNIRNIEKALGNGRKQPSISEMKNIQIVRRSIVANEKINMGENFTISNLAFKRPHRGLSPMDYWDLLGTKAQKDYVKDEVII